ncbi:uncharacterized protein LOC135469376 [Liolophura sinensis]|uniref:uncharacterized protein LOC135469376 n=1 Tax=Liolophura sinensis TaxID=3198878 RepID=UPI0031585AAA
MVNLIPFVQPLKISWMRKLLLAKYKWQNLRDFQYTVLHRITPTNSYLFKIGQRHDDICNYCRLT